MCYASQVMSALSLMRAVVAVVLGASLGCSATSPAAKAQVPASTPQGAAQGEERPNDVVPGAVAAIPVVEAPMPESTAAEALVPEPAASPPRAEPGEAHFRAVREPGDEGKNDGSVANVSTVMATMTKRLRGCYERGLTRHLAAEGRVHVRITVAPDGRVADVRLTVPPSFDGPLTQCLEKVARRSVFAPPDGGKKALVAIVVDFAKAPAEGATP